MVGTKFWSGLIDWMQNTLSTNGTISQKDFDLFRIVDTAEEAVEKITEYHNKYRKDIETNF